MIVAGIGCRRGTSSTAIAEAITMALGACGLARTRLDALATHVTKRDEPGLGELAALWQLNLLAVTTEEMERETASVETVSQRVLQLKGVPSVAEAAALAAAGPNARLLAPRVANAEATCAIAEGEGEARA